MTVQNQTALAEAFSSHRFKEVYEQLDEAVVWENVGGELYDGKQAVIAACTTALNYFDGITTAIEALSVRSGDGFVVVESTATYTDAGVDSRVSSCDIYVFNDTKLARIVSYNVERTPS